MRWHADRQIYHSLKADSLHEELEDSLRRLSVDTIDLYQIHWPNPESEIEEGWETLAKFKEAGQNPLYRRIQLQRGTDEARTEDRADYLAATALFAATPQISKTEILPFCEEHNIGVINYSPMVSGLLTGKMTAERIQIARGRLAQTQR